MVIAIAVLLVAFSGDDTRAASANGALTTPLWSPRRVPEPVADAVGAQHLQASLDGTVGGNDACFVVKAGPHVLASHNPDAPMLGASTQKVLIASTALTALGADSTFTTKVVAGAAPVDGSVDRLWLVGSGDPVLSTADYNTFLQAQGTTRGDVTTSLETLADAVVAAGVHRIPGGVSGDDSRYDDQRYLPSWKPSYRTDGEVGPLGALSVNGGFSAWSVGSKTSVDDPALHAASLLTDLLRSRGVTVGTPAHATAPAGAVEIAHVVSPPLRAIVASMLNSSDNFTAEMLTKELAVHDGTKPGTTAAGVTAIAAHLHALGITVSPAVHLVDGSGLSRDNRITCSLLIDTLGLTDQPAHSALFDGLSVAGQHGTLYDQFVGTALAGALRAKTGGLDGVAGLTGVISASQTLRFAYLDNGDFPVARGAVFYSPIAATIDKFPDAPSVDALVPAPK